MLTVKGRIVVLFRQLLLVYIYIGRLPINNLENVFLMHYVIIKNVIIFLR